MNRPVYKESIRNHLHMMVDELIDNTPEFEGMELFSLSREFRNIERPETIGLTVRVEVVEDK